MKIYQIVTSTLFALGTIIPLTSPSLAASDAFKSQFGNFVGKYKITGCSSRMLRGPEAKEKDDGTCEGRKYVNIFLGDGYRADPAGSEYFFNLSSTGEEAWDANGDRNPKWRPDPNWVGIDLATDPAATEDGETINSTYGSQIIIDKAHGFIEQSTVTKLRGLVYLHRTLSWPEAGENFLYSDMVLVLKKVK